MIALMPIYVKKLIKEISNVKNFGQKQVSVVKAEFFNRLGRSPLKKNFKNSHFYGKFAKMGIRIAVYRVYIDNLKSYIYEFKFLLNGF